LSFIKYSIISALLVLLYFIWLDKNYFYNSFLTQKDKNTGLIKQLKDLNQKLQNKQEEIKKLQKEIQKIKSKKVVVYKKRKEKKKVIKIILPKENIDYSKIISKEKYNFLDDKKTTIKDSEDDLKIIPSISFDKEKQEIDAVKVNIKTKF
jgi:seryl-tRNA synthetase